MFPPRRFHSCQSAFELRKLASKPYAKNRLSRMRALRKSAIRPKSPDPLPHRCGHPLRALRHGQAYAKRPAASTPPSWPLPRPRALACGVTQTSSPKPSPSPWAKVGRRCFALDATKIFSSKKKALTPPARSKPAASPSRSQWPGTTVCGTSPFRRQATQQEPSPPTLPLHKSPLTFSCRRTCPWPTTSKASSTAPKS